MTQTPAAGEPKKTSRQSLFLIGGVALVAVVIAVGAAIFLLGGDDEQEARGTCRGATWELNAERDNDEGNRMTAGLDISTATSGESWQVKISSNGKSVLDKTITSDDEGEIDASALLGTGEQAQDVKAEFGPSGGDALPCSAGVNLG